MGPGISRGRSASGFLFIYLCSINYKGPFTPSISVNAATTLRWRLQFYFHWKQWSRLKMGCNPILEQLHCFQWEQNRKLHRSVDADAWYKWALTIHLNRMSFRNNVASLRTSSELSPRYSMILSQCYCIYKCHQIGNVGSGWWGGLALPAATNLGQGIVFTGICDSVHRGGLPQCMLGYHPPWEADPPKKQTPIPPPKKQTPLRRRPP